MENSDRDGLEVAQSYEKLQKLSINMEKERCYNIYLIQFLHSIDYPARFLFRIPTNCVRSRNRITFRRFVVSILLPHKDELTLFNDKMFVNTKKTNEENSKETKRKPSSGCVEFRLNHRA
jgi:hypothetical protein